MKKFRIILIFLAAVLAVFVFVFIWQKIQLAGLKPIFSKPKIVEKTDSKDIQIDTFAQGLGAPRFFAWTPNSVLLVSITKQGRVVALPDTNADRKADQVIDIITGLNLPHGLAFYKNDLYIAETNRVIRLTNFQSDFSYDSVDEIISGIPGGPNHFTRTIVIGPDNKLYVSIGSSCNVCEEQHPWRATVIRANLDGSDAIIFASGLRNAVGLAFHPDTGQLWATENGRDLIGDDLPPEEINILVPGGYYGWPTCYGKGIHDTDFDKRQYFRNPCEDTQNPVFEMQAHVAPLGLKFYQGSMFSEYWGDLFVAYHGSWNRSIPVGYKVVRMEMKNGTIVAEHNFLDVWLNDDKSASGRPVDITFGRAGEIYISDDKAGVVYIVTKQ